MTPQPAPPSVLIADADPYICRVFEAKLIKEDPFRAMSVTTGQEALLAASQNVFSAILWDMRLRDTLRLLPRMRALCPGAVLLLLTTDDRPTLDSDLARLDVSDILVKPLNLDTLVDRVRAALDAPQSVSQSSPIDVARVGQRLNLTSAQGSCVTRVLENRQDTFTVVGAPRVQVPPDFRPGLRLRAQIVGEDAVYSFGTHLIGTVDEPIEAWEVQKPRVIRREQRRRFARHPLSFAISLELADRTEIPMEAVVRTRPDSIHETGLIDGQTEDVGIGGCALVADVDLPAGTAVRFVLTPSTDQSISGSGRIVRTTPFSLTGSPSPDAVHRLAVQFVSLPAESRRVLRAVLDPRP
jgi:DNA-binding NarL/FixJ family response regulator